MIDDPKPYVDSAIMKPMICTCSGNIPWILELPEHWKTVRAKGLFSPRTERARIDDDQLSATQSYGVIPQKDFERLVGRRVVQITQHLDKRAHVEPNDFIISMRSFQGGLERAWARGCIRSSYVVLKPSRQAHIGYFAHLFKSQDYIRALQVTGNFIRDGQDLNFNNFSLVDLPLPPLDEQAAIVRYLNHSTRQVDLAIHKKRSFIKLLTEQKQALIHQTVTLGLNLSISFKSSGISWLGNIPQHWEIRKLKFEMAFRGGGTPSKDNLSYWNGSIPWVSPKDMKLDIIEDTEDHITIRAVSESSTSLVPAGSLLMVVRSGILQRTIPIARCARELALNQDMKALTSRGRLDLDYFAFFIRGHEKSLLQEWTKTGATVESVEHQYLANTKVPIPPLSEQIEIVEFLDNKTAPLSAAISQIERELDLLRQYRTRLISDIVTGKLDVRTAAASLPADADETVPVAVDADGDDLDADEEGEA